LEGDFPPDATERVRAAVSPAPLIELTLRSRMPLGNKAPVIGTWQGVWPGIPVMEDGAAKAGPSGSPWINTNAGFLRAARAFGDSLDMIGARHTPVRAVPPDQLRPEALAGAFMAVDVDAASLTPQQREVLKAFTRSGGTLLTGPADWKESAVPDKDKITL